MSIKTLPTHYSMESHATIYDEEALTALQLAARTTGKVNEAVEAFNNLEAETNAHLQQQDNQIEDTKTVVLPNLVDVKLQQKIDDGSFAREIDVYAGELEKRVDNLLGSVGEGSTALDAEVIDVRVDDRGNVHTNAGAAVRFQASRGTYESDKHFYHNRLDPERISHNVYVPAESGVENPSDVYYATDYIHVKTGERLAFYAENIGAIMARFVAFFDSAKRVISTDSTPLGVYNVRVPENACFIRVTFNVEYTPAATTVIEYEYGHDLPFGKMVAKTGNLYPDFSMIEAFHYNRIDPSRCIVGAHASHVDGEIFLSENYACSNYIPVKSGETLTLFNRNMTIREIRIAAVYDKDGNFIADLSGEYLPNFNNTTADLLLIRIPLPINEFYRGDLMVANHNCPKFLNYGESVVKSDMVTVNGSHAANTVTAATLASGKTIDLVDFPRFIRKNVGVVFKCEFDSFSSVLVGHGGSGVYGGFWVKIDQNTVTAQQYFTEAKTIKTVQHGLTIIGKLICTLSYKNRNAYLTIASNGGAFHCELGMPEPCGEIFAAVYQDSRNVSISAASDDLYKDIWLVGDSYFGFAPERVIGQLENMGFDNYMVLSQPGLTSYYAYADLIKALSYATPKVIVWYMGMNDGDEAEPYATYFNNVKAICSERNIAFIANKVPSVPTIAKEAIANVIASSGVRYVDSYGAVGAANANWHNGLLASDGVHPTVNGAKVLAAQILVDVPEIMGYGRKG